GPALEHHLRWAPGSRRRAGRGPALDDGRPHAVTLRAGRGPGLPSGYDLRPPRQLDFSRPARHRTAPPRADGGARGALTVGVLRSRRKDLGRDLSRRARRGTERTARAAPRLRPRPVARTTGGTGAR